MTNVCIYREAGELANHRLGIAAQLDGGPGRGNLGSSHLLEARGLDTQTIDLAPAVQEPLMDPASLDLEASTLSRSFLRQKGNSRNSRAGEEEVLVSIEPELPCEASKLSQVICIISLGNENFHPGANACFSPCSRVSHTANNDPSKLESASC